MNRNSNGLMGQAGHFGALQQQLALQQQHHNLLAAKQQAPAAAKAQDTPLQVIHQQQHQHGACDAAAGKPSHAAGVRDQTSAQHGGTADHNKGAAAPQQQLQQQVQPSTLAAGSAVTGALVNALPPAVTGGGQHTQLQHPSVANLAGIKLEAPGSPSAAHSPTSTAPPPGNASSPTPEVSAHTAAAAAGSGGGRFQLPVPSPLPPPDATEGPEAVAEYKRYLERWGEGTTLAQRWHRLSEKGVLGDVVEEWEEWQNDLLLQGLQAQNKTAARGTRKHRRDEGPEVDLDAPRQTRTRRVPQALQDYQVEALTGTPEPPAILGGSSAAGAAAVTGVRPLGVPARASAQQQYSAGGADVYPAGGDGSSAGAAGYNIGRVARAAAAAPQAARPGGRGPSAAAAAAAAAPRMQQASLNKVPGPQQQYAQQQHGGHQQQLYSQQQQQRPVGANGYPMNGYSTAGQQQAHKAAQQQQQQQARANGYADVVSRGYDSHHMQVNGQAAATAAGLGGWPMQAQQQQQMGGAGIYHQQQQNGYHQHPGVFMPPAAASQELMMAQLLQMGSMANNSSSAAAAALPFDQAMSAAAAAMPPGVQFEAAFAAFNKILARGSDPVLGQVDPVAFTQHLAAALQQQQQR